MQCEPGTVWLTMDDVIRFYSVKEPFGFLSNFWLAAIELDGCTWPTVEHYFQANKFIDSKVREKIRKARSPMNAARLGRSGKHPLRPDWEIAKNDVMRKAIVAKFTQHAELRNELLNTGRAVLVEHTANDCYWGDGLNGTGLNMLGKLLMETRLSLQ